MPEADNYRYQFIVISLSAGRGQKVPYAKTASQLLAFEIFSFISLKASAVLWSAG